MANYTMRKNGLLMTTLRIEINVSKNFVDWARSKTGMSENAVLQWVREEAEIGRWQDMDSGVVYDQKRNELWMAPAGDDDPDWEAYSGE